MDTLALTFSQARGDLSSGRITPEDLQTACFKQIVRLNPTINAFITVIPPGDEVPTQNGALAGLPVAVKDLYDTAGVRTTAGSRFFKNHIPAEDAAAVTLLK